MILQANLRTDDTRTGSIGNLYRLKSQLLFFDVLAGTGTAYDMLDVSYAFL